MGAPCMIELRAVKLGDLDHFFAHQQDAEAVQMAAFTSEDPFDRDAFDTHWHRIMQADNITIRTITHDDAVVGHIAQFYMEGDAELTYWIDRAHWNRGIATEALRQFLHVVQMRPIHARAAADNGASIRVLEKAGFVCSGRERGFANARQAEIEEVIMTRDAP